nr:uncharacterized protein LOC109160849 [Ipomoea trifida]
MVPVVGVMGTNLNNEPVIKALQKSFKALELQHDIIENLCARIASLSATSHNHATSLANLERLVKHILTNQGKQRVQEEKSEVVVHTEGVSSTANVDHSRHFHKCPKVEFPLFLGEECPMVWLLRCESSFRHADTPNLDQVILVAYHMIGEAQLWYHSETTVSPFASWATFKEECCLSFGPPRSISLLGELKQLFKTGRHMHNTPSRVDLFTGGLDEVLWIDVERTKPSSLNKAINTTDDF